MRAVFTTRGAVIKSWQLKKYRDQSGRPYEIVAGHAPADAPLPFTLAVDDAALSAVLAAAPFTVASESGGGGARGRRSSSTEAGGVRAEKMFSIAPEKPYQVNVTASVTKDGRRFPSSCAGARRSAAASRSPRRS